MRTTRLGLNGQMDRRKDAVVTEASVTPIRPIIPLAALAIGDPKPYLSWSGRSPGLGYNVLNTIDTIVSLQIMAFSK